MDQNKHTVTSIQAKKGVEKLTILTAYNHYQANFASEAGIDILLVSDGAYGCCSLGRENAHETTMDELVTATKAVKSGSGNSFVIASMPFGTFATPEDGRKNAIQVVKQAGCDAVHLEGGTPEAVAAIVNAGIPVVPHVGLTKVSTNLTGVPKVVGRTADKAMELIQQAKDMVEAGAFMLILECMPAKVARLITELVNVPTVSIAAGDGCDGQYLVMDDILGLTGFDIRFVKIYADLPKVISDALSQFKADVVSGAFPTEENCYKISDEEFEKIVI